MSMEMNASNLPGMAYIAVGGMAGRASLTGRAFSLFAVAPCPMRVHQKGRSRRGGPFALCAAAELTRDEVRIAGSDATRGEIMEKGAA